jgi:4-hydroxy-tetrahydrodipicolinate reductase
MAGACGRMGKRILEMAAADPDIQIGGAFDAPQNAGTELAIGADNPNPQTITIGSDPTTEIQKADALIDFTFAAVCLQNIRAAAESNVAAIIGTTGLNEEQVQELHTLAKKIPNVYAPNMSIGVNLLFQLTAQVAKTLGLDYNVEIIDIHHNLKKDSPSGTAVRLAECAAEALGLDYNNDTTHGREGIIGERPEKQIGVHALRGGDVVGEHTVSFIGQGERIELTHKAHNRDNFARGALIAAKFAHTASPGLYDMQHVLGLK